MKKNELYHHGIKGQKWGERNYQYEDGTLTPEGKLRYGVGDGIKNLVNRLKARGESVGRNPSPRNQELNKGPNDIRFTNTHKYDQSDAVKRTMSPGEVTRKANEEVVKKASAAAAKDTKTLTNRAYKDLTDWMSTNKNAEISWLTSTESDTDDIREYLGEALGINSDDLPDDQVEEIRRDLLKKFDIDTPEKQRKKKEEELDKLSDAVLRGEFGNGEERKNRLGSDYDEVQKRVNKKLQHTALVGEYFVLENNLDEDDDVLQHHGLLEMKWAERRFQNKDRSHTKWPGVDITKKRKP